MMPFVRRSSMITRSAIEKMLASSCVTMTNVTPRLRDKPLDQRVELGRRDRDRGPRTARRGTGCIGSSAIARAMAARFCMPPEISAGRWPVNCPRPTSDSFIRAIRSISSFSRSVYSSSGRRTFSEQRHRAEQRARLVHDAELAQDRMRASSVDAVTMSSPSMKTLPACGSISPIMCFSSVLLPQPEPPRITNTSPRRTSKLTCSSSTTSS